MGMIVELNFTLLVIAALAGMVAKSIVGWDPWKLLGSLTLTFTIILLLPPMLPFFGINRHGKLRYSWGRSGWVHTSRGGALRHNRVPYNSLPERVEPLGRTWRAI